VSGIFVTFGVAGKGDGTMDATIIVRIAAAALAVVAAGIIIYRRKKTA
jgi:hypothetical protein